MLLLLLSYWIIAGISAEAPATYLYRVKNSSLCLQVENSPPRKVVMWTVDMKLIVSNEEVQSPFRNKMDYDPRNGSLCVSKLTEGDSGLYEVSINNGDGTTSRENHILTVEDTVPTPVIKMSVIHSNLSAGFCNITVNCSIQDNWVWSVCDGDGCRISQRSLRKVNITVSAQNRSVVCSGNNHVSTSKVSENIETTCLNESNPEQEEISEIATVMIITIAVIIPVCLFCLCTAIVCMVKRQQAWTSPAQLIQNQPVEAQPQPAPRPSTSSSSSAEVCYENVDAIQASQTSSPREELGSKQSQSVDTIYSFLQGANVTASVGESNNSEDSKAHVKIQEAPNSQSVTVNEAEQPVQIDTVYTVLQKPKIMRSQQHQ